MNTAALSAIRERIGADSKSGHDQQDKDLAEKSGNNKRTKDSDTVNLRTPKRCTLSHTLHK